MRYNWAPMFCYSGSSKAVPREFCGFKQPALSRFFAHRASRIGYVDSKGTESVDCPDPTQGYSSTAISTPLRNSLHCIANSYTIGNDDGWWQVIWKAAGTCAAKNANLSVTQYFQLLADTFAKYDVDVSMFFVYMSINDVYSEIGVYFF